MKISHFYTVSNLSSRRYKNDNFEEEKKPYKHEIYEI
jgi:hypothetical protein